MIRVKECIPPQELITILRHIRAGNNALAHVWDLLFDMGLIDTVTEEDGFMRDVLTEAGRKVLEGQVNNGY